MREEITKIVVWGNGNYYRDLKDKIDKKYKIQMVLDTYNSGNTSYPCLPPEYLGKFDFDFVLIMIKDIKSMFEVIYRLHDEFEVDYRYIVVGQSLFGGNDDVEWGEINEEGRILIKINDFCLRIGSFNEYYNVLEVLRDRCYEYMINNSLNDIVIDIGMNIGDSTMFFLKNPKTAKVYGFEPFRTTYDYALDNLKEYIGKEEVLETFQWGLSDVNEKRIINFNKGMPCAQSTITSIRQTVYEDFEARGLAKNENEIADQIEVKDAAEIIGEIINRHSQNNIVIKMDCEGEEYQIIKCLYETGLLERINFIMLEWHYEGNKTLIDWLTNSGFSYWHVYKNINMGLIYAYR